MLRHHFTQPTPKTQNPKSKIQMALSCKLRYVSRSLQRRQHISILTPSDTNPLSSHGKSRAALSLLRAESDPQRILDICRAASLTPEAHLDRLSFSKAIFKLKESNHFDHIRTLLEESKARPDNHTQRCISHFIVLYGQAGLLQNAIQTFQELDNFGVQRDVKSFNSLLFACLLAKDYAMLKTIYMDFPSKYGITPNSETYNTVIKGFHDSGQADSFYSVVAEMERKGIRPNSETFAVMIAGFYAEEKFEDVGKALEMMRERGIKRGVAIHNVRMQCLCKLGRMTEAKSMLQGMLSEGSSLTPNSVTYGHLVHGFCKAGNLKEAVRMFEEMKRRGLAPQSECYFTLVHSLCEGKDFKAAMNYCKECMEKNWIPVFTVMKSLVDGLVSISEVDEARQIIGQLKEKFSRNADKWSEIEESLPK